MTTKTSHLPDGFIATPEEWQVIIAAERAEERRIADEIDRRKHLITREQYLERYSLPEPTVADPLTTRNNWANSFNTRFSVGQLHAFIDKWCDAVMLSAEIRKMFHDAVKQASKTEGAAGERE